MNIDLLVTLGVVLIAAIYLVVRLRKRKGCGCGCSCGSSSEDCGQTPLNGPCSSNDNQKKLNHL